MGETPMPRGTGVSPVGSRDRSAKQKTMGIQNSLISAFTAASSAGFSGIRMK
jgi:hypothetical protein